MIEPIKTGLVVCLFGEKTGFYPGRIFFYMAGR
jgi:hypothetical protein